MGIAFLRAGAVLALAAAGFFALSWWALSDHLDRSAKAEQVRLQDGWHWPFEGEEELVGGQGSGLDAVVADGALRGHAGPQGGHLSLALAPSRIDATLFTRLEIDLSVDRATTLLLFHRETLDGAILATAPIPLDPGRQQLEVDLAARSWWVFQSPDEAASWGGDAGVVAVLRIHPALTPGTAFELHDLKLLPQAPNATAEIDWRDELARDSSLPRAANVVVPLLRGRPEAVLDVRDRLEAWRPAAVWTTTPTLRLPPPWLVLLSSAALLLLARLPKASRRMLLLSVVVVAGVGVQMIGLATLMGWILCLPFALGVGLLYRDVGPVEGPLWSGRPSAWWLVLTMPAGALALTLFVAWTPDAIDVLGRLPRYLPWAIFQQWLLQVILVRSLGDHDSPAAVAGAASIFGLLHLPNLSLMLITPVLAVIGCLHYRRHQALIPLAIAHAVTGAVLLSGLAGTWLRNGEAGPSFFG
ncbi:MAG: CPBP family glutamic-type intramembrane protease [Pseudomonadota bacterium]